MTTINEDRVYSKIEQNYVNIITDVERITMDVMREINLLNSCMGQISRKDIEKSPAWVHSRLKIKLDKMLEDAEKWYNMAPDIDFGVKGIDY